MSQHYFLIEDHDVTGPFSLAVLQQMAESGSISVDTPARPEEPADAHWMLIHEIPGLQAQLFPWTMNLNSSSPFKQPATLEDLHPAVDVEAFLQESALRQIEAENFDPEALPPGPRERRRRLFIIIALALNAPAFLAYCLMTSSMPAMVMAPTAAAIITFIVYWMLYHVMSSR
jgi:GYF domain 2